MDVSSEDGTEPQPGGDPLRRGAERVFVAWCLGQSEGRGGSFEELVAANPGIVGILVELRRTWDELGSLVSPGQFEGLRDLALGERPEAGPPGLARAEELLAGLAGDPESAARYVAGRTIAHGGMGTILSARDRRLRREVALKRLSAGGGPDDPETARARFLAEAYVTGRLDHPGIVPVHDLGLDAQGRLFFTMKLVDGITFREALERVEHGEDGWTLNRAVGVISRVCEAVAYAHSKGVLHRDIKPANVMVGAFGETYLMDWGLARVLPSAGELADAAPPDDLAPLSVEDLNALSAAPPSSQPALPDSWLLTQDGKILGTPVYMSPEQARGEIDRVDERSDIWSLGAILYHLLTGRLPWVPEGDRPLPLAVLLAVRNQRLPPARELAPDAPPTLLAICERALAVRPEDRYRGADEMAAALRDYLEDISEAREEARRQEARARNLLDFLLSVLVSGDPAEARGRDVTVREVVDRAAERLRLHPPAGAIDVANLSAVLGRLYKELGRFEEAGAQLETAVARYEEVLGPQHPDTLSTATDLALVLRRLGLTEQAESLLRATLEAQRAALGELHPDTLRSEHLLAAQLQRVRGEMAVAEQLYRRALAGRRITLGERHVDTLSSQSGLAGVLAELDQTDEAVRLLEDASAGLVQQHGEDHPAALVALGDLAQLYQNLGRLAEAEDLSRRVLATQERVVRPGHPDALTARNNLGMVLLRRGQASEALVELQAAADGHAASLGEDHARTVGFRANMALALLELGRLEEAAAVLRDVVPRAAANPALDPSRLARFRTTYGRCERLLGRFDEAERELLAAQQALASRLDAGHRWVRDVEAELAALRAARG